jgi:catechol 2,3-dioxygenase-like lactoylglutathione lyase family enzyme
VTCQAVRIGRGDAESIAICKIVDVRQNPAELFTRLAPVLNVRDVTAEREFYERLGLPVYYEGDEYPDFIAFGTDTMNFGIQPASGENDPPSVLTWQIVVSDIDAAMDVCRKAGIEFEIEQNDPAPGWSYRRLILQTPSGYRLALEEQASPPSKPG